MMFNCGNPREPKGTQGNPREPLLVTPDKWCEWKWCKWKKGWLWFSKNGTNVQKTETESWGLPLMNGGLKRGLRSTFCSRETFQNLLMFMYKVNRCRFLRFSFRAPLSFTSEVEVHLKCELSSVLVHLAKKWTKFSSSSLAQKVN